MIYKYYTITILVFGAAVGLYVYNLDSSIFSYNIPFTELTYNMPVAMWIVAIIYAFFLISAIFIFSERLERFLSQNAIKQDKKTFVQSIINKVIENEDREYIIKTNLFKEITNIVNQFDIKPKLIRTECTNQDLKKFLSMYENLNNGEEVDVHKFNIPQTSSMFSTNVKNSINKNYKNGLPILKNKNYAYDLKKFAFIALLKNADSKEIQKYKGQISYDKDISVEMINAFIDGKIELSYQEIASMLKNAKYTKDDYLNIIKSAKGKLDPDGWIKLSEFLADADENAECAYLYVLLELEMLDVAKNRLKVQPINEFINIRAYIDLKTIGKSYPIDIFFHPKA